MYMYNMYMYVCYKVYVDCIHVGTFSIFLFQNSSLVDFSLTNREVFGVWVCRDVGGEGEETVAMRAVYDE